MKKKPASKSAFFNPRVLIGFSFCLLALALVLLAAYPNGNAFARQDQPAAPAVKQHATETAAKLPQMAMVEDDLDVASPVVAPMAKGPAQPDVVGATFVVNTTNDTQDVTPGDGVCLDGAGACSLRAAITEANALAGADTITLPAGTYTITLVAANEDLNAGGDFDIRSDVTINGAGAATTIIQAAAAPNTATEKVLHITTATATAVNVNNVTIRNGHSTVNTLGGGVRIDNAANVVNFTNCIISGNRVTNPVNAFAGGLGITAGTVTLTGCTLSGNSAVSTGVASGNNGFAGGIYNQQATVNIVNSTITGNFASSFHGGIRALASTTAVAITNITNSTISNNQAQGQNTAGGAGEGGGVVNIAGSTFACTMNITASTINGNAAQVLGAPGAGTTAGGVENFSVSTGPAVVNMTNSTVSGNTAADAGGVYSDGAVATVNIKYSTIASNSATGNGGGLFQDVTAGGVTNLKSSIVADNTATTAGNDIFGTITSQNYNHLESTAGGTFAAMPNDVVSGDPALGALANNGGPTFTHLPGGASVVLNTIPNGTNECGTTVAVDQRALGRPSGAGCDKGSVEVQIASSPTPTPTPTVTPATPTPTPTPTASPSASCVATSTFTNPTAILVPAGQPGTTQGAATPYPSSIAVAGTSGTITKVTVVLSNITSTFPGDYDILLVGPGGQSAIIMSDCGGGGDVSGITLTLDDAAAANMTGATLVTGTFKPTNLVGVAPEPDTWPAPAPAPPAGGASALSAFNGTSANGTWNLWVFDDAAGDVGNINGGWTLNITTGAGCGTPTPSPSVSPGTPTPTPTVTPGTPTPTATASPVACSWLTAGPAYPIVVADAASVTLGGNIYVFGGFSNSVPVTAANKFNGTTWTAIAPLPAARASSGAVTDGTFIYILNGATTGGTVAPSLFRYDPVANTYATMAAPTSGSFGTAAVFLNGKVYRICGDTTGSGTNQTNTVEAYTVSSNTWAAAANFPAAVSFANAIAGTNVLYAGGGVTSAATDNLITAVYDPIGNTWNDAAIADLPASPAPHWGSSNAVINGQWVIGPGASGGAIQSTAISWNPLTNIWSNLPNAPLARYRNTGATLGTVFYSIGGNPFVGVTDVQRLSCPSGGATPTPSATVSPGTPTPTPSVTASPSASPTCTPGLTQGFDDITTLPAAGWVQTNHSTTIGTTGWFQGNDAVFPSHSGATTSYIGANFNNTTGTNTISNWLLTPAVTLQNGASMIFWTRTTTANPFPDRLQVRMSTNGASSNVGTTATDVGDFTTLLLDIDPTYTVGTYPEVWTQFTVNITGVPSATLGRLAFRYFVENGGPTGANSNYIGIDDFQFNGPCGGGGTPTPSPSATASPSATVSPCPSGWSAGPNVPPVALVRAPGNFFPANGRFYSIGGRSADVAGADFTNPFEYNPTTNAWTTKPSTLPDGKVNNMACGVLTVSGTPLIYCTGGSQSQVVGTVGRVFTYNPATDTFATLAAGDDWPGSQAGTFLPGGFAVNGNKLYIIGSFNANATPPVMTAQVWQFDPTAAVGSKWLARADYPLMRGYVPAASIGGFIYTGGGSALDPTGALIDSAESFKYDVAGNAWTPITNIPRATGETRAVVMNGTMWVLGGGRTAPNPSNEVDIYNPVANSWSVGQPMTTARRNFPADSNGTDRIFVAGGYGTAGLLNTMEIFSPGVCPTPTPSPSPSGTPVTPTPSPTPTASPSATASPSPSATPATPTPTPSVNPAQAVNFSTRMKVLAAAGREGIGGFIVTGSGPKNVIIRAIGPSLTRFGITDALADPTLELHGPSGFTTVFNNNWRDTQQAAIEATGLPPTNNLESAIVATLNPGAYTAIVRGNGSTPAAREGVALVEVYDLNQSSGSKLANISTRAFVNTDDDIVIAGFILGNNSGLDSVIVRGMGPSLSAFGLSPVLANPTLELRDNNGALLFSNNDWQDNPVQAAIISGAGLAPSNNLEAAIAATLPPNLYTALLAGLNGGTGIGLVEVYDRGATGGIPVLTPTPTPPLGTPSPSPSTTPGGTPSPSPSIPPATPTPSPSASPSPAGQCAENFDSVTAPALPSGWTATNVSGNPPMWVTTTVQPDSAPNDAFVDDQNGISDKQLDSRNIVMSPVAHQLSFRNWYDTEHDAPPAEVFWDGYVLEVSKNGGAFVDVTDPSIGGTFVSGPYTGEIDGTANNPLAGRMAWSGISGGGTSAVYIDTVISIPASVSGPIKLRFRMGSDEAVARPGARVDGLVITNASCP